MDTGKMGELIRQARKEKGLTQKDVAQHLGITDRAVSKWERGICAPDIALLEPLGELLGLTVSELIAGARETVTEERETAVRETLQYSKQEISQKDRAARRKLWLLCAAVGALSVLVFLGVLWYRGFFHRIGTYPSPDGSTVTTVYSCRLGYRDPPTSGGFTLSDEGQFRGRTIYSGEFRGLWWSPNGRYQVVSMYENGETILSLADFTRNIGTNLTLRLKLCLYENEFFADVPYDEEGSRDIRFDFIQWSEADPAQMLVYFRYTDIQGQFREGYMWYDYESGQSSGEMKLPQGEKEENPLNALFPQLG